MGTYQRYASMIKETEYQLRILKDWIQEAKECNDIKVIGLANLMQKKLEPIFKIYETK